MWKVVTSSNLNPLLKLYFYSLILANNNMLLKIYYENIVIAFLNCHFLFFILFFPSHHISSIRFFFFSTTHVSHSFPLSTFFFFFQFIPDHFFNYLSLSFSSSLFFHFFYFYLILEHSLPLSHIKKFSLTHTQITDREVEISVLRFFFFFYQFILLFRFHQAYERDCFCVSNLSIGFCVLVLIVVYYR